MALAAWELPIRQTVRERLLMALAVPDRRALELAMVQAMAVVGRYAMVEPTNHIVVNVIEWDGDVATWSPPADCDMVPDPDMKAGPGYTYEDGVFKPPSKEAAPHE
jgi:hypothetical protein